MPVVSLVHGTKHGGGVKIFSKSDPPGPQAEDAGSLYFDVF